MTSFLTAILIAVLAAAIAVIVRQAVVIRATRAAGAARRFAAEIIDNAGEGIVVYDRDLRYVLWNRFMEELTGLREADAEFALQHRGRAELRRDHQLDRLAEQVEVVTGDASRDGDLGRAMEGIASVYHLGRATTAKKPFSPSTRSGDPPRAGS